MMRYECCVVCGCDPCDCHPNGEDDGPKYIYTNQRSERSQSNRESDPQVYGEIWNGKRPSHSGGHTFGVIRTIGGEWSANQQTQSHTRSPNPSRSFGRTSSDPSHEKGQHTTIHSGPRIGWRYL